MNNQELLTELKRIRFNTVYHKLSYVSDLIDGEYAVKELLIDRYLRKIKRYVELENYTYNSTGKEEDEILFDLKQELCYELECNIIYSIPNINLSPYVKDLLFNPDNLDEQTLRHLTDAASIIYDAYEQPKFSIVP